MARFYRRRRGYGRRRYIRRRFGVGGGNRKRPSSYSVAYGFTKQFDKLVTKWASSLTANGYGDLYSKSQFLANLANMFISNSISDVDKAWFRADQATIAKIGDRTAYFNLVSEFFAGVSYNHVENPSLFVDFISRGGEDVVGNQAEIDRVVAANRLVAANQAAPIPQAAVYKAVAALHINNVNNHLSAILVALKTQLKDAILKVTKRNLPFSLAVSSWAYSFLKYKKRRKKYLNFWKWKSVPRFIILIAFALKQIWSTLKYGSALSALYNEIDFVQQTASRRQLLQYAQAGVQGAREQLERLANGNLNMAAPVEHAFDDQNVQAVI